MNIGKENEQIEFKESLNNLEDGLKGIVAILNKHNKGTLYFGVRDDGEVIGGDFTSQKIREIHNHIQQKIEPKIYPEINLVDAENGKQYIKIEFSGKGVFCYKGVFYKRVADKNVKMDYNEIQKMFFKTNYANWETLAVAKTTVNDLDPDRFESFVNFLKLNKPDKFQNLSNEEILIKLNLMDKEDKNLTNAGNLLFSKNEPIRLYLKLLNDDNTVSDYQIKSGNIFDLIEHSVEFITNNINSKYTIVGLERQHEYEIQLEAIREIVVNSFAHADYLQINSHTINISKKMVEIWTPGSYYHDITPEDFAKIVSNSKVRNHVISNVLVLWNKMESLASGFAATYNLCKKGNINLDYDIRTEEFVFRFLRKNEYKLNKTERSILLLIKANPSISSKEIGEQINLSQRQVQRILKRLTDEYCVQKNEVNNKTTWEVLISL